MEGFLFLNKPTGLTSAALLNRLKRFLKESGLSPLPKIGHGGTLDKFAAGLLIVGLGRPYTKQLHSILRTAPKTYQAIITFGTTSTTDDPDGNLTPTQAPLPDLTTINQALASLPLNKPFTQTVPAYSARKIGGVRASDLIRSGTTPPPKTTTVTIHNLKINSYRPPHLTLTLTVSAGFYVRALARDLGQFLNTGAYLSSLTRTKIGSTSLKKAVTLDSLTTKTNWPLRTSL